METTANQEDVKIMNMVNEVFFNGEAKELGPAVKEEMVDLFAKTKAWFAENGVDLSEENLQKYKDQVIKNLPPEVQDIIQAPEGKVWTPEQLTKEIKDLRKAGFWVALVLLIIIIIKK